MVKAGGDSWYFITADYAFGKALQRDTTAFVAAAGGKVLGSVGLSVPRHHRFLVAILVQAQSSGAKVLGFANAGADTVNTIKQAHEFGITHDSSPGCWCSSPTCTRLGLRHRAGARADRELLLGPERPHARVLQPAVGRRCRTCAADHGAGRRAIPATLHYLKAVADMGVGAGEGRRRGDGRADEGDADRRRLLRPGHDPRGRPQAASVPICSR